VANWGAWKSLIFGSEDSTLVICYVRSEEGRRGKEEKVLLLREEREES
jgi:hypothetical protein